MKKLVIPSILTATVLIAGMFAFMPIEKASTVHSTITTNSAAQDRWISGALPDIASPADGLDLNLSADVTDGLDLAGGYLYIDETDVGADAEVVIYCDENADGVPDVGERAARLTVDGVVAVDADLDCDFLRIDLDAYNAANESVDVYYQINIDDSAG